MTEYNSATGVHDKELQEKLLEVLNKIEDDLSNILKVLKKWVRFILFPTLSVSTDFLYFPCKKCHLYIETFFYKIKFTKIMINRIDH